MGCRRDRTSVPLRRNLCAWLGHPPWHEKVWVHPPSETKAATSKETKRFSVPFRVWRYYQVGQRAVKSRSWAFLACAAEQLYREQTIFFQQRRSRDVVNKLAVLAALRLVTGALIDEPEFWRFLATSSHCVYQRQFGYQRSTQSEKRAVIWQQTEHKRVLQKLGSKLRWSWESPLFCSSIKGGVFYGRYDKFRVLRNSYSK